MRTVIQEASKLSPQDYQAESDALDGRLSSEHRQASMTQRLLRALLRSGVVRPWFCESMYEVRTCIARIGTLWRLRTVPINCLGPQFGIDSSTGRLTLCTRTRGRRLDTHKFLQVGHRSPADLEVYLAGWNAGAKWEGENGHFCTPDKESGLFACMEPPARTRV
jgi:hypothetical protein